MTWFHRILRERKGFTLVELLLVVAILGILAALGVSRVLTSDNNPIGTARTNKNAANQAIISSAVERYRLDHEGKYPGVWSTTLPTSQTKIIDNGAAVTDGSDTDPKWPTYFGKVPDGTWYLNSDGSVSQ